MPKKQSKTKHSRERERERENERGVCVTFNINLPEKRRILVKVKNCVLYTPYMIMIYYGSSRRRHIYRHPLRRRCPPQHLFLEGLISTIHTFDINTSTSAKKKGPGRDGCWKRLISSRRHFPKIPRGVLNKKGLALVVAVGMLSSFKNGSLAGGGGVRYLGTHSCCCGAI